MQMVETPILHVRYGIECSPLVLTTDSDSIQSFLLDNVNDEIAARLPSDTFLKMKEGRYIAIKPVTSAMWQSIFPGVSSSYQEPRKVDAPSAGKTIPVPPAVQERVSSFTDERIRIIVSSVSHSFVSSYDVYRLSAVSGHIEKAYVPLILEHAALQLIDEAPESVYLVGFMNSLYNAIGLEKRIQVDAEKVLSLMDREDRYSDEALIDALPQYLARSDRLITFVDSHLYQLVVFNAATNLVTFENFDCAADMFRFLLKEEFTRSCPTAAQEELQKALSERLSSPPKELGICGSDEPDSMRAVSIDTDVWEYPDPDSRRIFVIEPGHFTTRKVGGLEWISETECRDSTLRNLYWHRRNSGSDTESSEYPCFVIPDWFIEDNATHRCRRLLLDELVWDQVFDLGAAISPAQRIFIAKTVELGQESFITSGIPISSYLGAVYLLRDLVLQGEGGDPDAVKESVLSRLVSLGYLRRDPMASYSSFTDKGISLADDLGCLSFRAKQAFVRMWQDPEYLKEQIWPLMEMRWPFEAATWTAGYEIGIDQYGWFADRSGVRVCSGCNDKAGLLRKLREIINKKRVQQLQDTELESYSYWYLMHEGMRYPLGEDVLTGNADPSSMVATYFQRPVKRTPVVGVSNASLLELGVSEFLDDGEQATEQWVAGALETLQQVLGLDYLNLSFGGRLGIQAVSDGYDVHLGLWNDYAAASATIGGFAYAWGALLYEKLTAGIGASDQLYFPDVECRDLKELFRVIAHKEKKFTPSSELYDLENQLVEELNAVHSQAGIYSLANLSDDEFLSLCVHLSSIEDSSFSFSSWYSRALQYNSAWQAAVKGQSYLGLTNYVRSAIDERRHTGDFSILQGRNLFAKAFESYVEDACRDAGIRNDFLVYGTRNEDRMGTKIYPEGLERYSIKRAFDTFFTLWRPELA